MRSQKALSPRILKDLEAGFIDRRSAFTYALNVQASSTPMGQSGVEPLSIRAPDILETNAQACHLSDICANWTNGTWAPSACGPDTPCRAQRTNTYTNTTNVTFTFVRSKIQTVAVRGQKVHGLWWVTVKVEQALCLVCMGQGRCSSTILDLGTPLPLRSLEKSPFPFPILAGGCVCLGVGLRFRESNRGPSSSQPVAIQWNGTCY
jgi:hypothetical protein